MEKGTFVNTIATRLNVSPTVIEVAVDATLAEILTPMLFAPAGARRIAFDNNCGNNCAAEVAARTQIEGIIR